MNKIKTQVIRIAIMLNNLKKKMNNKKKKNSTVYVQYKYLGTIEHSNKQEKKVHETRT